MPLDFLEMPVKFHNTDKRVIHNKRGRRGKDLGVEGKEVARVRRRGADSGLTSHQQQPHTGPQGLTD